MALNVTLKCIKEYNPGSGATIGQTYKIENGRITYDNGKESFHEYESLEHLNSYNKAQFQESKKRGRPKMNA
jgi:predicted HicB family RNase H-like nuclease